MKKIIAMLLAILMAVCLLSACGEEKRTEEDIIKDSIYLSADLLKDEYGIKSINYTKDTFILDDYSIVKDTAWIAQGHLTVTDVNDNESVEYFEAVGTIDLEEEHAVCNSFNWR